MFLQKDMFLQACADYIALCKQYPDRFVNSFDTAETHIQIGYFCHSLQEGNRREFILTNNGTQEPSYTSISMDNDLDESESEMLKILQRVIIAHWQKVLPEILQHYEKRHLYVPFTRRILNGLMDSLSEHDPVLVKGIDFDYQMEEVPPVDKAFHNYTTRFHISGKIYNYLNRREKFLKQEIQYPWIQRKFEFPLYPQLIITLDSADKEYYYCTSRDGFIEIKMKKDVFHREYMFGGVFNDIYDDLDDRYLRELPK